MTEKNEQMREQEDESQESSNILERSKVSPMERAFAGMESLMNDTPECEEETLPAHGIYIDDMGREHSADEILAQGIFYTKPEIKKVTENCIRFTLLIAAVSYVVLYLIEIFVIQYITAPRFLIVIFELSIFLVPETIALYWCITGTRGILHRYKADGRAFYVTVMGESKVTGIDKITGKEQILYKDVVGVAYTPTTLLLGDRGYKVDIITTYGVIHYDYIFPRFKHRISLEDLPFDVIKRNIPNRDDTDQQLHK